MRETCRKGHAMTPENTKLRPSGYTQCRQCERASAKKRRELFKKPAKDDILTIE